MKSRRIELDRLEPAVLGYRFNCMLMSNEFGGEKRSANYGLVTYQICHMLN